MKKLAICLLLSSMAGSSFALEENDSLPRTHDWSALFEQLNDYDDIESRNLEDLYEQMCELEDNPVDLNDPNTDNLQQLSFLSSEQLEGLTEYVDRYRPLKSYGEVAMVESMDPLRLKLIRYFTYLGKDEKKGFPSLKNIARYGKHEFMGTVKIPFYERKGDKNGYLGYKYKHWLRYKFSYGQYLQIGLTATQDAGEPFFAGVNNFGYDHYAYYAVIRKLGIFNTIALGQYKLRFGMGLVMNTGFAFGKTTSLTLSYPQNTVSPNTSRSEAYFLQGAATTIGINKHLDATAFVSYRKIDATLNDDNTIKTILQSGYHRTASEIRRKHNASQNAFGANIRWHANGFHAGATAIHYGFDKALSPDISSAFRRYNPQGSNFWNASVDYGFMHHRISINGETATGSCGALATINSVFVKANHNLSLTAIQRYYSYRYYSLFSNSFSDGGNIQNESGIYIGASWSALPRLTILAYSDFAYHPWPTYQTSQSSSSLDNVVQTIFSADKFTFSARYRLRIRKQDIMAEDNDSKTTINKYEHRARLSAVFGQDKVSAKTQLDAAYCRNNTESFGWMLSQNLGYSMRKTEIYANVGYFHTHDYNSRIYAYERGTLNNFSFPMFYGHGMRAALNLRTQAIKNIVAICKIGTTKYFDRDKISSSYQEIDGSSMTDAEIQIKWKF